MTLHEMATGDTDLDSDELPALPEQLDEAMPLAALDLSVRMLNALERLGAHSVGELLALPRIRLYRNKGIGLDQRSLDQSGIMMP